MTTQEYIEQDIHIAIKDIPDNTYNFIYTSPPYGITTAEWDKPLNWDMLFPEMWRVLKDDGIIALHASMPFTYELLKHSKILPRYHYSWKKNTKTGFFTAKKQPLRQSEEILIYYKTTGTYNPQMVGSKVIKTKYRDTRGKNKYYEGGDGDGPVPDTTHTGLYPSTHLEYSIRKDGSGINRSDDMMDFFIKTYTNKNDYVLDMTCHNKYLGNRCKELERNYLGIDICL